jgi:phospholipase A1/A2
MTKWIFLCLFLSINGFAQTNSGENKPASDDQPSPAGLENADQKALREDTPFSLYKDTYALAGYSNSALNKDLVFKFQLSAKFRMPIAGLYLAYTQRSFMDLLQDSRPFTDHSYEPEVYYTHSFSDAFARRNWIQSVQGGYRHSSNGLGDGGSSRSWERIYVEAELKYKGLDIRPAVWLPFVKDTGNADVEKYWGYGELALAYVWDNDVRVSGLIHVGTDLPKGNIKLDMTLPFRLIFSTLPTGWKQSNLWFQVFHGYGETFLGFKESSTAVAVGLGFRPDFSQ